MSDWTCVSLTMETEDIPDDVWAVIVEKVFEGDEVEREPGWVQDMNWRVGDSTDKGPILAQLLIDAGLDRDFDFVEDQKYEYSPYRYEHRVGREDREGCCTPEGFWFIDQDDVQRVIARSSSADEFLAWLTDALELDVEAVRLLGSKVTTG